MRTDRKANEMTSHELTSHELTSHEMTSRKANTRHKSIPLPWRTAVVAALLAAAALLAGGRRALAQENPEQLRKMYEDAVKSLRDTQDRAKELADENAKLKATVDDLNKKLGAVTGERDRLEREQEEQADKTFFLRSHYAAWEAFIRQYPELRAKWKVYMQSDFVSPRRDAPKIIDEDWPTSADS